MDEAAANKDVMIDFFNILGSNKIHLLTSYMDDEMSWIIPQDPKYSTLAGIRSKTAWVELYSSFLSKMPKGATYKIIGITAENDRVAVEAESFANTPLGPFHNRYHFLFVLRNRKILVAKEYADSLFMYKFKEKNLDFFVRLLTNRFKKKSARS